MTKFVIDWLKNVRPDLSESDVIEINQFFDKKYYSMLKNGSDEKTASDNAWHWIDSIYLKIGLN